MKMQWQGRYLATIQVKWHQIPLRLLQWCNQDMTLFMLLKRLRHHQLYRWILWLSSNKISWYNNRWWGHKFLPTLLAICIQLHILMLLSDSISIWECRLYVGVVNKMILLEIKGKSWGYEMLQRLSVGFLDSSVFYYLNFVFYVLYVAFVSPA